MPAPQQDVEKCYNPVAMLHLSSKTSQEGAGWNFPLGLPGFRFADLNRVRRIAALDSIFRDELKLADPVLASEYEAFRKSRGEGYDEKTSSDLIIRVAAFVGPFIAKLFRIEHEHELLGQRIRAEGRIFEWKKRFLDKRVLKNRVAPEEVQGWDLSELEFRYRELVDRVLSRTPLAEDPERELAEVGLAILEAADSGKDGPRPPGPLRDLATIERWARALAYHPALRHRSSSYSSFKIPENLDYDNLVHIHRPDPKSFGNIDRSKGDATVPRRLQADRPSHDFPRDFAGDLLLYLLSRAVKRLLLQGLQETGRDSEESAGDQSGWLPPR